MIEAEKEKLEAVYQCSSLARKDKKAGKVRDEPPSPSKGKSTIHTHNHNHTIEQSTIKVSTIEP